MDEEQRIKYTRKLHEWQNRTQKLIDANPTILRRSSPREQLRNIPEELGITPPRNPPGVEIFVNQPPEKPKDDKIRSVIDVKAYSRPKTPPPAIGPSEAERRRDIERIKAKTRLVRQKADELYIDAKIARYNAQVASTKAQIAARNADMAKQKANQISRAVRVKAILRDRLVFYQNNNAKLAIAKAKRLHSVAEIKKTEARASQRRYYTLMKLDNGGKLTVAPNGVARQLSASDAHTILYQRQCESLGAITRQRQVLAFRIYQALAHLTGSSPRTEQLTTATLHVVEPRLTIP